MEKVKSVFNYKSMCYYGAANKKSKNKLMGNLSFHLPK